MSSLELRKLSNENFEEFANFLKAYDSGCYCAFWHQKFSSMDEWDRQKAENPDQNKVCMQDRVRANFHLGVLVYRAQELVAWVSVGPLVDFYWTWKRVAQVGESANTIAGIPCITRKSSTRDSLPESEILRALIPYAKEQGWTAIEGFPFDRESIAKHGKAVTWAGFPEDFESAQFEKIGAHWLSSPGAPRSIYRWTL